MAGIAHWRRKANLRTNHANGCFWPSERLAFITNIGVISRRAAFYDLATDSGRAAISPFAEGLGRYGVATMSSLDQWTNFQMLTAFHRIDNI